jgi:tetratricopeptide (TPR) repeat protein
MFTRFCSCHIGNIVLIMLLLTCFHSKAQNRKDNNDTLAIAQMLEKAQQNSNDTTVALYLETITAAKEKLQTRANPEIKIKIAQQLIRALLDCSIVYFRNLEYAKALEQDSLALKLSDEYKETTLKAESYFNLAEVFLEQSKFKSATECYRNALEYYSEMKDPSGRFWSFLGLGIVQKQTGNFGDAIDFYNQALVVARQAKMQAEEASCLNNLGNIYRKQGDFSKAMESYQHAIEVFRTLNDDEAVSDCLNNIGNLYLDNGDPFRALDYYKQALAINLAQNDQYRLIIRYKNLAGAYTELKDYDNARQYLDDALILADKSGDKSFLASCNMQMGKLHSQRKDFIIAIAYYTKAENIYAETGSIAEQCESLIQLAFTKIETGALKDARSDAKKALELAVETGSLKSQLDANLCMVSCLEKANALDESYPFLQKVSQLKDSIYTAEKYRTIEEIEADFARNELRRENEILTQNSLLQKKAIRAKNLILFLLGITLMLSGAVIWLVYKRQKEATREVGRVKQSSEESIEKLHVDLVTKERELTTKTISINQKNQILEGLIGELDKLKNNNPTSSSILQLQNQLKTELSPNSWKEFEIQFNEVHPGFQNQLLKRFPGLSPSERRLCSFLRLDMNTREIASLTGQTFKSIEVARTRIRKKMNLSREENLSNFIASI